MTNQEIINKTIDYLKIRKGNFFAEKLLSALEISAKVFKDGEPCLNPRCLKDKPVCRACGRLNAQGEVKFNITEDQKISIIKKNINPQVLDGILYGENKNE